MKTIGFVGTAKNTGKTTTALHILELVSAVGKRTALTSIGFDGENTDHVTGLPKPRYCAHENILIATADSLLEFGTARYSSIIRTGQRTILGEIVIAEVAESGFVVLAGPNRRKDLKILQEQIRLMGVELLMVDGALNRLAALTIADGMVLSTGAAFDEHIDTLADHAQSMESLFHYPGFTLEESLNHGQVAYLGQAGDLHQMSLGSVLDEASSLEFAAWFEGLGPGTAVIPGVFSPELFQKMVKSHKHLFGGSKLIFTSPLNLLASGEPQVWQACFEELSQMGCGIFYSLPIPLNFMTVNPFFPKYLQKTGNYIPAYVEKLELLQACQKRISRTPVVDILQPPHPDLLQLCGIN